MIAQTAGKESLMATTAGLLAQRLRADIRGEAARVVRGAASIDTAGPDELTHVANDTNLEKLPQSSGGTVIISRKLAKSLESQPLERTYLIVENAQESFVEVLFELHPRRPRPVIGISPHAHVAASARIGAGTNVYPGVYVCDDVVIGERCDVYPGVYLGGGCQIGDDVVIHANAVLYEDVIVGNRVIIDACATIGADGFGYRLVNGRHVPIPQVGTVRIEDDVEIGAATTVDRAMLGETLIGEGSKIDNLVTIAHNCRLGKHNVMVSQVGLAGSVTTGDYVVCAGQVGIADHVHLGERAVFGAKAGVHRDMAGNQKYIGIPALPETDALRIVTAQIKLPELRKQVRELQAQVQTLTRLLQENKSNKSAA
jgi:UDP-3-O-[3-hydroxymyristoyl] glucosamine N-acyltransferase